MFHSNLPLKFWHYSLLIATWLLIRIPNQILEWKSPYEVLFAEEPDFSMLGPFGCLVYAANLSPHRAEDAYILGLNHPLSVEEHTETSMNDAIPPAAVDPAISEPLRRSTRHREPPVWIRDFVGSFNSNVLPNIVQAFTIKDIGVAKYFLGMEITRTSTGTSLNQWKYVFDILSNTGMIGCYPALIPLPPGLILTQGEDSPLPNPDVYRRLMELLYLNLTRPDISFAAQQLSQFVGSPTSTHWNVAVHVLHYLKGCPSLGLFYYSSDSPSLLAYSDAHWGACKDTRESIISFCVFLGKGLVSWRCKKQKTIYVSFAEAEYRALNSTARELTWLVQLFNYFSLPLSLPISLLCDNLVAIHITKNIVFHECTKHIDIDCHVVHERFRSGLLTLTAVTSRPQLADLFTKPHLIPLFRDLLSKMCLLDIYQLHHAGGCKLEDEEV